MHRWYKALRCKDKSVLETLVSYTKSGAREAALSTLATQTEGTSIAASRVIAGMSADNALRSSAALHPFINRTDRDAPRALAISVRESTRPTAYDAWAPGVAIGWARVPNAARSAALHACVRPPPAAQPPAGAGAGVLWSVAVQELCPRSEQAKTVPGVLERHALVAQLRASETRASGAFRGGLSAPGERASGALERHITAETSRPLPSAAGGVTRSFLGLKSILTVHEHTWDAARALAEEALALHAQAVAMDVAKRETATLTAQLMGESCRTARRLRAVLHAGDAARQGPADERAAAPVHAVPHAQERAVQGAARRALQRGGDARDAARHGLGADAARNDLRLWPARAQGGGRGLRRGHPRPRAAAARADDPGQPLAARVPRQRDARARDDRRCSTARAGALHMQRALLYVGSSQASFISEAGTAICAAAANANINSSKKISCADMNTLALLSIYDVWAGGIGNVHRSFPSTVYSGAYGPTVSHGLTSVGLMGHFFRSDGRGHGSHTLSPECADELAAMLADRAHWVRVGAKKYALAPVACRGIPHGLVPGVHAALDELVDGLAAGYEAAGKDASDMAWTKTGLFSLPFSAVTQALRPDVESTADSTLRHCFREPAEVSCATGRSYLPDATHEDDAIFTEPLWRRPCQASVGDNPFATSYEYADSVWNLMNALSVIAERARRRDASCASGWTTSTSPTSRVGTQGAVRRLPVGGRRVRAHLWRALPARPRDRAAGRARVLRQGARLAQLRDQPQALLRGRAVERARRAALLLRAGLGQGGRGQAAVRAGAWRCGRPSAAGAAGPRTCARGAWASRRCSSCCSSTRGRTS